MLLGRIILPQRFHINCFTNFVDLRSTLNIMTINIKFFIKCVFDLLSKGCFNQISNRIVKLYVVSLLATTISNVTLQFQAFIQSFNGFA